MPQLICHLLGDYVLQNSYMATYKTQRTWVALLHALVYMLPFVIWLRPSPWAFCLMCGSHAFIDRYRLAKYWLEFYGVGTEGMLIRWRRKRAGQPADPALFAPEWLYTVLLIVVDNTFHLLINFYALARL